MEDRCHTLELQRYVARRTKSRLNAHHTLGFHALNYSTSGRAEGIPDGLSCSFLWLGSIGINPLEFPGRSAVVEMNSLGLVGTFFLLAGLYLGSVYGGWKLTGSPGSFLDSGWTLGRRQRRGWSLYFPKEKYDRRS